MWELIKEALRGRDSAQFERHEKDFRFGYDARQRYPNRSWDEDLEKELASQYGDQWDPALPYVRQGFELQR